MISPLFMSRWTLVSLILSSVQAGDWTVRVPSDPIQAPLGSSVVLPCTYDFPAGGEQGIRHKVLSEMWCLNQSHCITPTYLYHSARIFPEPSYQGRVQYFGQTGSKNCTLKISDLRSADSGVYVFRFITDHRTHKLPGQRGVTLRVTESVIDSSSTGTAVGLIVLFIIITALGIFITYRARQRASRSR